MRIELKNLKISRSLSEETTAFTAMIHIDGKPAFHASNHGTGGPDLYQPIPPFTYADEERINAFLAEHEAPMEPFEEDPAKRAVYDTGKACDLELFVGRLISDAEEQKEWSKLLSKVALYRESTGVFGLKGNPKATPETIASVQRAIDAGQLKDCHLLNGSTDEDLIRKAKAAFGLGGDDPREAVMNRLGEHSLTAADARWLIAQDKRAAKPDLEAQAEWLTIAETQEARYAAYCAERDAARKQEQPLAAPAS